MHQPCTILPGVGPQLASKLAKRGINSIQDLLFHLPYKYQDRTRITAICDLRTSDWAVIEGEITKSEVTFGKRRSLQCYVQDMSGFIKIRLFHFSKSQQEKLSSGTKIRLFGEAREFNGLIEMVHPEYKIIQEGKQLDVEETLTPIYPAIQGLSQTRIRQLANAALNLFNQNKDNIELFPNNLLQKFNFPRISDAINFLHNPPPDAPTPTILEGNHPAQKRLALEELLSHYLSLRQARAKIKRIKAPACTNDEGKISSLLANLDFKLTNAQQRVIDEILTDLAQNSPMQRLVQGDVGSGKTIVAAIAALKAIECGYQVALMAPTEILAEQHTTNFNDWFAPLGINCVSILGKHGVKTKRETKAQLEQHQAQLAIGTHALFQDDVQFAKLGLVIIDEQHRFGVHQRLSLSQKAVQGQSPHQLIMTATPIPRTLAMTNYADLDTSIIDELPPGRTPIKTAVIGNNKRDEVITRLAHAIAENKQAYWVCTLIEESEKLQCMAAEKTAEILTAQLPKARIGLVHGRMKAKEKDSIMLKFKNGEIDLLVATTVIEVGVNVPNASLMIIENPERLGLSQLHQLRGRVGRGNQQSHCVLLYQHPVSRIASERLKVMRDTTDGFIIAEKDLEIRGAGEILGTKQTGSMQFKIADLERDKTLFEQIPQIAKELKQTAADVIPALIQRWLGDKQQYIQS
jgi:ATP-dependent DNA helicase RecG